MDAKTEEILERQYYTPSKIGSFGGINRLRDSINEILKNERKRSITRK